MPVEPDDAPGLRVELDHARAAIEALRRDLREQRREAQHRVRNVLAMVRSIARRTIDEGETAETYQALLDGRLASFARVQGLILRSPTAGVDLDTLVAGELLAYGIRLGAGARVAGDAVVLTATAAGVLGLAFHELTRMTIEGALTTASRGGGIDVRWDRNDDSGGSASLVIDWRDTALRSAIAPASISTFGHEILEQAVAYELNGTARLEVADGGLTCRFFIPYDCVMPR